MPSSSPATSDRAPSARIFSVRPLGARLAGAVSETLVKTDGMEVVRIALRAGHQSAKYMAASHAILQVLEGRTFVEVGSGGIEISAGDLLHLLPGEVHALRGITDSSLLLVAVLPPGRQPRELESADFDVVDEELLESFPASDPPARTPVTGSGARPTR